MTRANDYNRTIKTVLNLDTGKLIYADKFFNQKENIIWHFRQECQEAIRKIRTPFLVCDTCGQLIQISGGKGLNGKITYFKHLKDSNDCPIKTDTKLSRSEILRGKFNGQKEGVLHIETKNFIAQALESNRRENKGVAFVDIEIINRDNRNYLEWKKPDITSVYLDKKLVFEIQLSTTFLDVICERQYFYKENKIFILWVFKQFEIESDKQKFTQKDVFYSNNRNAFVLDEKAIDLSIKNSDLYLLCQYQRPKIDKENIVYEWESKYVCLSDLFFNENSYKVYYFDVDKEENKLKTEIENRILESNKSKSEESQVYIIEKNEIEKHKLERQNAIDEEQLQYEADNFQFFQRLNDYINLSPLQNIYRSNIYEIPVKLQDLFRNGYKPSKEDLRFVNNEYQIEKANYSHAKRHSPLYFLSLAVFCIKLMENVNLLNLFPRLERILIATLSIKEQIVIGYSFQTLVQIPHLYINNKSNEEFTIVILEAIKSYYGYEKFIKERDLKKALEKKIHSLKGDIPPIKEEYKTAINLVFKNLIQ